MAEAIFGLIGVIVGGLLNRRGYVADRVQVAEGGSEDRRAIVIAEIRDNERAFELALEERSWGYAKDAVSLQGGTETE